MAVKAINRAEILGRVGSDPEIDTSKNNRKFAKFRVATWTKWKDKQTDEWQEKTEWHSIIAWGYQAEACEKIFKGDLVYIAGSIEYSHFETESGETKHYTSITAREINVIGRIQPRTNDDVEAYKSGAGNAEEAVDEMDEEVGDLPF